MECKDIIKSKVDKTQKFVLLTDKGQVLEVSYINKDDGKHILCVPTQTNCKMGCKFCHTADLRGKIPTNDLIYSDIVEAVRQSLNLAGVTEDKERTLLVSYMGNGEPMENIHEVIESMREVRRVYEQKFKVVRFAVSTLMPRGRFPDFAYFGDAVRGYLLNVKLHVSLHFTNDAQRHEWMPMAENIEPTLHMLEWYRTFTGNAVELHYTPIAGVNDRDRDIAVLCALLCGSSIPIKFLKFSPMSGSDARPSQRMEDIINSLEDVGVPCEYYDPPGRDIGSSCGMFLADYYTKYTTIKTIKPVECKHENTRDYRWEHDDGYGRQTWITGRECTSCHKVCLWPSSNYWCERSECHTSDYGGPQ